MKIRNKDLKKIVKLIDNGKEQQAIDFLNEMDGTTEELASIIEKKMKRHNKKWSHSNITNHPLGCLAFSNRRLSNIKKDKHRVLMFGNK